MADIFLSYRNTPERRRLLTRLVLYFQVHGISTWWDYGLEAGEAFEERIRREIDKASIVMPVWCFSSVYESAWVIKEAEWGKEKLFPIKIQDVTPPNQFEACHAADLVGWDGDTEVGVLDQLLVSVFRALNRPLFIPRELRHELKALPRIEPLDTVPEEYVRVIDELRDGYIKAASDADYGVLRSLSYSTPVSALGFTRDLADDLVQILSACWLADELGDSVYDIDPDELTTVGALIEFILQNRSSN